MMACFTSYFLKSSAISVWPWARASEGPASTAAASPARKNRTRQVRLDFATLLTNVLLVGFPDATVISPCAALSASRGRRDGPRRHMLLKVTGQQAIQMEPRALAFDDRMRAAGVLHKVKWLAELHQPVDQQLGALVVHVVVARPVHQEQLAAQSLSIVDSGAGLIPVGVVQRLYDTIYQERYMGLPQDNTDGY